MQPRQLLAAALLFLALPACTEDARLLSARQAKSRYDLVGGPVAYADIGDFVLENDKVRVAVLGSDRSWGPGVYGGSLVDADLRRTDARFPPGSGRDKFAEIFPFANLLVPAPIGMQVTVLKDGSDGKEATIRVEGKGQFLFEGLGILRRLKRDPLFGGVIRTLFPGIKTELAFRTDYTLKPGERFVRMKSWIGLLGDPDPATVGADVTCALGKDEPAGGKGDCGSNLVCKTAKPEEKSGTCQCPVLDCKATPCEMEARQLDDHGCQTCKCGTTAPMLYTAGTEALFDVLLGDSPSDANSGKPRPTAGIGAGDFVFFGNQTDIFVPGHGFDEEKPVWDALFLGRDTFKKPLGFDFVGSAGGDVSYGYFSKQREGLPGTPQVLVPVFTSAATAFITATFQCKRVDDTEDAECAKGRVFEFERFLAIGDGDMASVYDEVLAARGSAKGHVEGVVRWQDSGTAAVNASVFVLRNPQPGKVWGNADEVIEANRLIDGSPGVVIAIDADVGLDLQEDGDFHADLAPGDYVLVAMDEKKILVGAPVPIHVVDKGTVIASPALPTPARLRIYATDGSGAGLPAKVTVQRLGPDGQPLWRDGGRRPYFGQGRLGIGVQAIALSSDGHFDVPVEAGKYRVVVSHGPEFGIGDQTLTLTAGEVRNIQAVLPREIDSAGWVATDFHLHAEPSFDSGMPLDRRVQTIAAEGLDYVASTDHDVLSNYTPFIRQLGLDQWLEAVVGSEVSTLEIGHYIGFPLKYDQLDVPSHGSIDWYCKPSHGVVAEILKQSGFASSADKPTTIVAHPRDGFLGWLSQAGVNPFNLTRHLSQLEAGNPVLRTVACDFDAFEVFNGKRLDLVHTATVLETQTFQRCLARIDRAGINAKGEMRRLPDATFDTAAALDKLKHACPELKERGLEDLAKCPPTEDFLGCQHRYRIGLARVVGADVVRRTPAEADKWLDEQVPADPKLASDALTDRYKALCKLDPATLDQPFQAIAKAEDLDRPCSDRVGTFDDELRFLEHGFVHTMVGGSDSHGSSIEPGTPRTYIKVTQDAPGRIDAGEVSRSLRAGQAIASYGPFVAVTIDGQGPGATVKAQAKGTKELHVKVQTASWYGIDRLEVYVNGRLALAEDLKDIKAQAIVDLQRVVKLDVPDRDSWVIVKVLGTEESHLMRPVVLDVPFGELQLPRVAAIAFANLPAASSFFPPPSKVPDFYPIFPMAISNPIFLDVNGNGRYDALKPLPAFCSPPCDPATGKLLTAQGTIATCAEVQADYKCLSPENRCGLDIPGVCDIYHAGQQQGGVLGGK